MTSRVLPTQVDTLEWCRHKGFPLDPQGRAMKLGEEAGEVLGAVVKMAEGRKSVHDLAQETAQLVICALALAQSAGFDLEGAIADEWDRCGTREWGDGNDE